MTDPERISRRSGGLAAQLLRASADEQPSDAGVQRTLTALGVSSAVLTTTSAAGAAAAASGAKLASAVSASAGKAVTGALLLKWVGVGVVGGVGLAGAAALVAAPFQAPPPAVSALRPQAVRAPAVSRASSEPRVAAPAPEPVIPTASPSASPRTSITAREPTVEPRPDVGAPLAAEVAFVDDARSLLAAGRSEAGLAQLSRYEREFPEARLLPEVLFLQLESYQRLGRTKEAQRAAERLASGFPKSPHAARARAVLGANFP